MRWEIIGDIRETETIAAGSGVKARRWLHKRYGGRRWRKCKGTATLRLSDGTMRGATLVRGDGHWSPGAEDQAVSGLIMRPARATSLRPHRRTAKVGRRFAVCVENREYPVSLQQWKIYRVLPDPDAERHGQIRVIDESGEDYLFPSAYFRFVALPPSLRRLYGRA